MSEMPAVEMASFLSREDHEKWFRDLIGYGQAFVAMNEDGSARYVPPSEWMALHPEEQ